MRKLGSRTARLGVLAGFLTGVLVATTAPANAVPGTAEPGRATPAPLLAAGAPAAPDRYVVVLSEKPADTARSSQAARSITVAEAAGGTVLNRYTQVLDGYAAHLPPAALAAVRNDPAVAYVEPDTVVRGGPVNRVSTPQAVQPNPPSWGLDRIDQHYLPLNNSFGYTTTGSGVTAYVFDSGIRATHVDFGTRAAGAYDAVGDGNGTNDCHGHGTHVAGTIGGTTYGVAKAVTIRAVRVLQCDNSGWTTDLIEGLDWVAANHAAVSVANFSLQGYGTAPSVAVENLIDSGVYPVFIANNFNTDACTNGPRSTRGITVAATDSTDNRASFSSYGSCVDVFAPGVDITSAGIASNTAVAAGWGGTSMAAPHVTGWLARYRQSNPTATLATAKSALIAAATTGVVINPGPGSPNRLLYAAPSL
ncbi:MULTISPECIES: S8 family peptidase [Micromonospora]|uniref:Serine protease, subtilisin family n=1 Tax=Micromonospora yangpuensis TaxID=683228 RepID=A0A1C6VB45_9ACTN|nr:S8 family peptidase [Micromonospora yangpuensis]GGM23558.1 serine protease [Micromonospora yangpuensis]SCL63563.1 Serine protease, subtilisin family [Micromonospora yangpuensis]